MALSGSFNNYPTREFGLYCEWSGVQNQIGRYTDVTLNVYLSYSTISVGAKSDSLISINGEEEAYTAPAIDDSSNPSQWNKRLLKTKTVRVIHDADGQKNGVKLSASYYYGGYFSNVYVDTIVAEATVDLDPIKVGLVYIGNGSTMEAHQTYIHNGTNWELHDAYVHDGTDWNLCS